MWTRARCSILSPALVMFACDSAPGDVRPNPAADAAACRDYVTADGYTCCCGKPYCTRNLVGGCNHDVTSSAEAGRRESPDAAQEASSQIAPAAACEAAGGQCMASELADGCVRFSPVACGPTSFRSPNSFCCLEQGRVDGGPSSSICPLLAFNLFAPPCLDVSCGASWDAALSAYSACNRGPNTAFLSTCGTFHAVVLEGAEEYEFTDFYYDDAGNLTAAHSCGGQGGCFFCCFDRRSCWGVPLGQQCQARDETCAAGS